MPKFAGYARPADERCGSCHIWIIWAANTYREISRVSDDVDAHHG